MIRHTEATTQARVYYMAFILGFNHGLTEQYSLAAIKTIPVPDYLSVKHAGYNAGEEIGGKMLQLPPQYRCDADEAYLRLIKGTWS